MTNDLENVNVGDKLLSYGRWEDRLEIVTKVTKTQIITNVSRYRRDTGRLIGAGAWNGRWVRIPTQDDFARLRLQQLRYTLEKRLDEIRLQIENMDEETVTNFLKRLNLSKE